MSNEIIVETIDRIVRNRKVLQDLQVVGAYRTEHEQHPTWLAVVREIVADEDLIDGEILNEEPGVRLV